jgi:hypothetical protein
MKKLLIISVLLSSVIISCNKDDENEPDVIRAYCYLYHFIPQMSSVIWEVDGVEVPDDISYAYSFPGALILEESMEEFEFAVKQVGSNDILVSRIVQLEQNKFYNIIVCGPADEAELLIFEIETSAPTSTNVKVQAFHSIPGQGPIDLFMGDTTLENRVVTELDYLELTEPFQVTDLDIRAKMIAAAHDDAYNPDSLLLSSDFNEIISGASYLTVVAPYTHDTSSSLTFWMYALPTQ